MQLGKLLAVDTVALRRGSRCPVQLKLGQNNLQGTIPTEVGLFTALTSGGNEWNNWLFYANSLTGSIPSEIGLWTNMHEFL